MDILIIIAVIWWFVKKSKKSENKKKTGGYISTEWAGKLEDMGRELTGAAEKAGRSFARTLDARETKRPPTGKEVEREHARRHAAERRRSEQQWADARKKQADSLRVHAVGVDSCEGRLESLRVLYDAGILDREEYLQRVARVKRMHNHR